jgi:hypothetical protein
VPAELSDVVVNPRAVGLQERFHGEYVVFSGKCVVSGFSRTSVSPRTSRLLRTNGNLF